YETDIDSIAIKNNEITFTYDNGKSIKAKYQYLGYYIQHWKSGTKAAMYRFENIDKKSKAPRLFEINDHMIKRSKPEHFHLRTTNTKWEDIDAENNWPTFFPKSSTPEDIVAELSGVAHSHKTEEKENATTHDHDHDHDNANASVDGNEVKNRELSDFEGEWKSLYIYIRSGQFDEVSAINAKNIGDKTEEEYKEHYKTNFKSEFDRMIIKGNKISFIDENGKSVSSEYINRGPIIVEWSPGVNAGFYQYEAKDKTSGVPKFILFNDHNNGPAKAVHIHFRSSDTLFDSVDRENKVWATYYPESMSDEDIISSFTNATGTHSHNSEEEKTDSGEQEPNHEHTHEQNTENDSNDSEVEENSEDENDALIEANKTINSYDAADVAADTDAVTNVNADVDEHEHEHAFYHDLMDDCQILECNRRFITLVELLKVTGNPEADEFEEFVKYYQKNNCDALHKLVDANSGSISIKKISVSFIITILLSFIYLF
ncbi:hypothetical protein PIROE2DRAFT_7200, partial [Piromyces sp. E2]